MGDLTKNLSRSEFTCGCGKCLHTPVDFNLPLLIQDCIDHLAHLERNKSMMFQRIVCHITSGYRCQSHNAKVGGSATSLHTFGMAADHWMEYLYGDGSRQRVPEETIAEYYEYTNPDSCGVGRYNTWTHVDVRKPRARWDKR